jgi:hypothetical protein
MKSRFQIPLPALIDGRLAQALNTWLRERSKSGSRIERKGTTIKCCKNRDMVAAEEETKNRLYGT